MKMNDEGICDISHLSKKSENIYIKMSASDSYNIINQFGPYGYKPKLAPALIFTIGMFREVF